MAEPMATMATRGDEEQIHEEPISKEQEQKDSLNQHTDLGDAINELVLQTTTEAQSAKQPMTKEQATRNEHLADFVDKADDSQQSASILHILEET